MEARLKKPDFVEVLLEIVGKIAPLDAESRRRADAAVRSEFGGREVRIRQRPPVHAEQIDEGLRAKKTVVQIGQELGVSRETIYRALRKSRRPRRFCDSGAR